MDHRVHELFNHIHGYLDEIEAALSRAEHSSAVLSFEKLEESYTILRSEVEREINLSRVERDLYSSPRSLSETLDHITNIIKKEFEFSRFDIVLMDHEQCRVLRRYSRGGFGEEDFKKLTKHGALTVTRDYCLANREPWIVNDLKTEDPKWEVAVDLDVWAHGTFPLYQRKKSGEEELVGYLHGAWSEADVKAGKRFTEAGIREMKRLGQAITVAIREAKLSYFEHAIMRIQKAIGSTRIETSSQKILDLADEQDQNEMDKVIDTIVKTIGADCGGVLMRENDRVTPVRFRNYKEQTIDPDSILFSLKPHGGIISTALLTGRSVVENEVVKAGNHLDLEITSYRKCIHTLVAIPLIEPYRDEGRFHQNIIGAIVLINQHDEQHRVIPTDFPGNEGGFSSMDRQILEAISPHIETILSNTRSHQQLRRLSLTDGLTQLANHTHFMSNLLTLEFQRSQRYGTPLSILLMDIDHFKVFNDIYGHQVGDLVLRETARILRDNTRGVDHIARYGGEEFAVLLHNTNLKDALAYAEKIRIRISEGDYISRINTQNLFAIDEAHKRFRAILDLSDERIRDAKIAVMLKHFKLDPEEVVRLIESGAPKEALQKILESFRVSLSIGLAYYPDPRITSQKDFLTSADMLLLRAKERGRNRVEALELL